MNRLLAYSAGLGVVMVFLVFGIGLYFTFQSAPKEPVVGENMEPIYQDSWQGGTFSQKNTQVQTVQTETSNTIVVKGSDGEQITVNDFYQWEITVQDPNNPSYYYLDGIGDDGIPFDILYGELDQSFTIRLKAEPLSQAREQAEQVLMKILGIPESSMCQLHYLVLVPYRINSVYAGKNLGFSFCDGATVLP
mgnify:CR=1 FL=1